MRASFGSRAPNGSVAARSVAWGLGAAAIFGAVWANLHLEAVRAAPRIFGVAAVIWIMHFGLERVRARRVDRDAPQPNRTSHRGVSWAVALVLISALYRCVVWGIWNSSIETLIAEAESHRIEHGVYPDWTSEDIAQRVPCSRSDVGYSLHDGGANFYLSRPLILSPLGGFQVYEGSSGAWIEYCH